MSPTANSPSMEYGRARPASLSPTAVSPFLRRFVAGDGDFFFGSPAAPCGALYAWTLLHVWQRTWPAVPSFLTVSTACVASALHLLHHASSVAPIFVFLPVIPVSWRASRGAGEVMVRGALAGEAIRRVGRGLGPVDRPRGKVEHSRLVATDR